MQCAQLTAPNRGVANAIDVLNKVQDARSYWPMTRHYASKRLEL